MERFIDIFQHKQELRNNGKILAMIISKVIFLNGGFSWLVAQIFVLTSTWTLNSEYFAPYIYLKSVGAFFVLRQLARLKLCNSNNMEQSCNNYNNVKLRF